MRRRVFSAAYYAGQALTVACLLVIVLRLWTKDLDVPFLMEGDSLFWAVMVEAVYEDGWGSRVSRLGAPFGSEIVDWPMGMPFDFGVMSLLRTAAGTPGAALNLYWLLSVVATGLTATLCLRWLALAPPLAFSLGALYALLPYAFGHSTGHIPLVFHFIPVIAFLALRLAAGDPRELTHGQRLVSLAACLLQGLSYIYYSFFSTIVIVAAFVVGWARDRRPRMLPTAALALGLLFAGTLAGLAPSLTYWHAHGRNPELGYKTPSEADTFGLRIRHMLTPIPDHPIPAFRHVAEAVRRARFPGAGENVWARLGTVGGAGLLMLLGVSVAGVAGVLRAPSPVLRSAASLTLVTLLVAQVGGFGSLFNVFVTPDIRAYSRTVVFIAFFSLVGVGLAISRGVAWLGRGRPRASGSLALGAAALLLPFSLDQASTTHLVSRYEHSAARYEADRRFVARVESLLPQRAMVYQLRHTDVPVERVRPPMALYDHGWAFLHSKTLRWSWGAVRGRQGDWQREVSFLPPDSLVRRVALAGFSGIWVDRYGYADEAVDLVRRLAAAAGERPIESENGRFAMVRLVRRQSELESELGPRATALAREEALTVPVVPRWGTGCDTKDARDGGRYCGPTGRLFLKNTMPVERHVTLHAVLAGPSGLPLTISTPAGHEETILLDESGVPWQWSLSLAPSRRLRIDLSLPATSTYRPRVRIVGLGVAETP